MSWMYFIFGQIGHRQHNYLPLTIPKIPKLCYNWENGFSVILCCLLSSELFKYFDILLALR